MNALVDNLLDMARIQSGEVKLRRQWLPFEEVVGGALKSAQAALARHRVEVDLARDLPLVELDATLIERVLYNLLENAGKYTPDGYARSASAPRSPARICSSPSPTPDRGLPKGQEEAIFEKFVRAGPRIVDAGRRTRTGDQPRDRRGASRQDLGREQSRGGARFCFTLPLGHAARGATRRKLATASDRIASGTR